MMRFGQGLMVTAVLERGVVASWNEAHPLQSIEDDVRFRTLVLYCGLTGFSFLFSRSNSHCLCFPLNGPVAPPKSQAAGT